MKRLLFFLLFACVVAPAFAAHSTAGHHSTLGHHSMAGHHAVPVVPTPPVLLPDTIPSTSGLVGDFDPAQSSMFTTSTGSTAVTNGDSVGAIKDRVGGSLKLLQATSGRRPFYVANQGGFPALAINKPYTGTVQYLSGTLPSPISNGDFTAFIVVNAENGDRGTIFDLMGSLTDSSSQNRFAMEAFADATADILSVSRGNGTATQTISTTTPDYNNSLRVFTVISKSNLLTVYLDDSFVSETALPTYTLTGIPNFGVGMRDTLQAWLYRYVLYSRALTDSEWKAIKNYLVQHYSPPSLPIDSLGPVVRGLALDAKGMAQTANGDKHLFMRYTDFVKWQLVHVRFPAVGGAVVVGTFEASDGRGSSGQGAALVKTTGGVPHYVVINDQYGHEVDYNVNSHTVTDNGLAPGKGGSWATVTPNGKVAYLSVSPECKLIKVDIDTGTWTDLGRVDSTTPVGANYVSSLGMSDVDGTTGLPRYVYCVFRLAQGGANKWWLAVYDTAAATFTQLHKANGHVSAQIYQDATDANTYYVNFGGGTSPGWYSLSGGALTSISAPSTRDTNWSGNINSYGTGEAQTWGTDFGVAVDMSAALPDSSGAATLGWTRIDVAGSGSLPITLRTSGLELQRVMTNLSEQTLAMSHSEGPVYDVDLANRTSTISQVLNMSGYDMLWANSRWWLSGYATLAYVVNGGVATQLSGFGKYHYWLADTSAAGYIVSTVRHDREAVNGTTFGRWAKASPYTKTTMHDPFAPVKELNLGGATAGTFTFTIDGQTATAIPYNVGAATLQTTLRALATTAVSNMTVSLVSTGIYDLTFKDSGGNTGTDKQLNVSVNGAGLTVGAATATIADAGYFSCVGLAGVSSGTKAVVALNAAQGVGTQGRLDVIDPATMLVERVIKPMSTAVGGAIIGVDGDGLVGVVGTTAYRVNTLTGATDWSVTLPAASFTNVSGAAMGVEECRLQKDSHGNVLVQLLDKLYKIDPATGTLTQLASSLRKGSILSDFHNGYLYLTGVDSNLQRVPVP